MLICIFYNQKKRKKNDVERAQHPSGLSGQLPCVYVCVIICMLYWYTPLSSFFSCKNVCFIHFFFFSYKNVCCIGIRLYLLFFPIKKECETKGHWKSPVPGSKTN